MGDMADWHLDHIGMDDDSIDDLPRKITCKYCGKTDLFWRMIDGRWMLFSDEDPEPVRHLCRKGKAK